MTNDQKVELMSQFLAGQSISEIATWNNLRNATVEGLIRDVTRDSMQRVADVGADVEIGCDCLNGECQCHVPTSIMGSV